MFIKISMHAASTRTTTDKKIAGFVSDNIDIYYVLLSVTIQNNSSICTSQLIIIFSGNPQH